MQRQDHLMRSFAWFALGIGALSTTAALAVVAVDGTLHFAAGEEWNNPRASTVQTNYTQFGDQRLTPGGFPGSEIDELYVKADANFLYVGVTGNLEQSGNMQTILIEARTDGQNVLKSEIAPVTSELPCSFNGPPGAVQGLGQALLRADNATPADPTDDVTSRDGTSTGTTLDAGFAPNYAISLDTNGGTLHVSQYTLGDPTTPIGQWDDPSTGQLNCLSIGASHEALDYFATRVYRGSSPVNGGNGNLAGGTNPNGSVYAYNNTGKQGVTGASETPPPAPGSGLTGDPRTQTTGLEAKISLKDLGFTTPNNVNLTIKISVILTSGDGFVSNQTLPGIGSGTNVASLGFRPDFTTVSGNQFATVTRTTGQFGAPGGSIDGTNIVNDFTTANVVASQDTVTGFGDRNCLTTTAGSELDELYLRTDGEYLYVAASGNLETNSNAQILFLDVQTGGQNALKTEISPNSQTLTCPDNGPPSAVPGLGQALATNQTTGETERSADATTTVFDTGFEPETAIAFDTTGGTLYVNQYSLSSSAAGTWDDPGTPAGGTGDCSAAPQEVLSYFATRVYRGNTGLNASGGVLAGGFNPNGSLYAFNNNGVQGVTDLVAAIPGSNSPGDPRTQTTGLEAKISLLDLGFAANQLPLIEPITVKVSMVLTTSNGFVSNQTLPGLAGATSLGLRPNFTGVGGNQFATVTLTPGTFTPVVDGQNLVGEFGVPALAASQDTATGFGDAHVITVTDCDQQLQNGSEIDQMFVRDQATPDTNSAGLAVGITGNLEKNGNNLVIFLDTKAGGEGSTTALDANAGRLAGNAGDRIPLDADYAVLINLSGPTMYIDLIDLQADLNTFVGSDSIPGDGVLTKDGNSVSDWRVIVDDGNLLGVTATNADPQSANALTATTGFEMIIPRSAIGSPTDGTSICMFAAITGNGGDRYLSNQFLPSLPAGGKANYGTGNPGGSRTNLVAEGYTCLPVTLGPQCANPRFDSDGDEDVDMDDFGAFQKCYTGGGGSPESPIYQPSCECFDWGGFERNGNINSEDFGAFQLCASGSKIPANPACDDPPAP